jgi:spore photoproduct lyase
VCPGTEQPYICCYYWTLHAATNCPFDCSYCILQYYLNNPLLTVFSNISDLSKMVRERVAEEPDRLFRVGTGELADSLALDPITHAAQNFIHLAAMQRNMLLELKTKSDRVEHLLDIRHSGKTVIAWSLNPPAFIRRYENGAAQLKARLTAAQKAMDAGYLLAFHFDPLLLGTGWKAAYESTVQMLFEYADPARVAWISLGSLRFPPEMAESIRRKFPGTDLPDAEMIRGTDKKARYFKPLRIELYQHVYRLLRRYGGEDLFIYFCMEDTVTWERVMGFAPDNNEHLDFLFADHLFRKFPELKLPLPDLEAYRHYESRRSWEIPSGNPKP